MSFFVGLGMLGLCFFVAPGRAFGSDSEERCAFDGYRIQDRFVTHSHQGKTYKFCTKFCVQLFEKNPGKYLAENETHPIVAEQPKVESYKAKTVRSGSPYQKTYETQASDVPKNSKRLVVESVAPVVSEVDQRSIGRYSGGVDEKAVAELNAFVLKSKDGAHSVVLPALETNVETEYFDYSYEEPSLGVKLDGDFFGISGGATVRASSNGLMDDNLFYFGRAEGRFYMGETDYQGSGTYDGLKDYGFDWRGLVGGEFLRNGVLIAPYTGLGWRRHQNKLSEIPARIIDGNPYLSGYDRQSTYMYMPLGISFKTFMNKWSLQANFEYDWMFRGEQVSHLEQMYDLLGVNAGFSKLTNDQDEGYGYRLSLKLAREFENFDFYVEPFYRYWNIEDSDIGIVYQYGIPVGFGLEPANDTQEFGLKVGIDF